MHLRFSFGLCRGEELISEAEQSPGFKLLLFHECLPDVRWSWADLPGGCALSASDYCRSKAQCGRATILRGSEHRIRLVPLLSLVRALCSQKHGFRPRKSSKAPHLSSLHTPRSSQKEGRGQPGAKLLPAMVELAPLWRLVPAQSRGKLQPKQS